MTINGTTYETILDIERLIIVQEARLDLYKIELKAYTMQCLKVHAEETKVKINIQTNFINQLKERRDCLYEQVDKMNNDLASLEYEVFKEKFLYGTANQLIEQKLAISETTLFRYLKKIENLLNSTPYGELITETLKE